MSEEKHPATTLIIPITVISHLSAQFFCDKNRGSYFIV